MHDEQNSPTLTEEECEEGEKRKKTSFGFLMKRK